MVLRQHSQANMPNCLKDSYLIATTSQQLLGVLGRFGRIIPEYVSSIQTTAAGCNAKSTVPCIFLSITIDWVLLIPAHLIQLSSVLSTICYKKIQQELILVIYGAEFYV